MKNVAGVALIVCGLAFGLYVGLWLCFIGGIVQIVEAVTATPVQGLDIAIGIVRIIFAGAAGVISAFVAFIPGAAMLNLR
jgi:hypothetical protein